MRLHHQHYFAEIRAPQIATLAYCQSASTDYLVCVSLQQLVYRVQPSLGETYLHTLFPDYPRPQVLTWHLTVTLASLDQPEKFGP